MISIPFYRLRSTSARPGSPIFLLAGGPGSSWLDHVAREENFREVHFYRSVGDVVLFDQRGGGHSLPAMTCPGSRTLPAGEALEVERIAAVARELSTECRDRWLAAGTELSAYNTVENAADVNDLRTALGYAKMSLVGGSYGSHLALALMRLHGESVDRVVMYGVEGPDHTWDDPGARLRTLERIAAAAEASEELGPQIPAVGLLGALRTALERLEREPVAVSVRHGGEERSVVVDATLVRWMAGRQAGRRSRPNAWPELILRLYEGELSPVAEAALALRNVRVDKPMHYMMDCASGVTAERAARYGTDPARELLGDINFEYAALCDVWSARDLGAEFRAPLASDIPTLIVHGTWDTSTPIENAREVASTLKNGQLVEVVEGTHGALYNLYEHWPPARSQIGAFLRGEKVDFPASITLPRVRFERRPERR